MCPTLGISNFLIIPNHDDRGGVGSEREEFFANEEIEVVTY